MQTTFTTLYAYWNQVRAGRIAPRRLEIEPSALGPVLASTFMLEHSEADQYLYRLAGTRVCDMYGVEMRGQNFLSAFSADDRRRLEVDLKLVRERGAMLRLATVASADARHALAIETILLPLVHSGAVIDRIIGASVATNTPHWLGHTKLTRLKLLSHETVWPDGSPVAVHKAVAEQPLATKELANVRVVRSAKRTFRVVQGGRRDPK